MATREVFDCSAPALNFFNRQESFRNCGGVPNPQTIDEYAQKGWYFPILTTNYDALTAKTLLVDVMASGGT